MYTFLFEFWLIYAKSLQGKVEKFLKKMNIYTRARAFKRVQICLMYTYRALYFLIFNFFLLFFLIKNFSKKKRQKSNPSFFFILLHSLMVIRMLLFFNNLLIGIIKHLNKTIYGSIFRKELLYSISHGFDAFLKERLVSIGYSCKTFCE